MQNERRKERRKIRREGRQAAQAYNVRHKACKVREVEKCDADTMVVLEPLQP